MPNAPVKPQPGARSGRADNFPLYSHLSSNTFPRLAFYADYSKVVKYRQLLWARKRIFRRFVYMRRCKVGGSHNFLIFKRNFLSCFLYAGSFLCKCFREMFARPPTPCPAYPEAQKGRRPAGLLPFLAICSQYAPVPRQQYMAGFSMVSTFKNWLVPREAFKASPATQAT